MRRSRRRVGDFGSSVPGPAVLEALLNGYRDVEAAPWALVLREALDERLRCSARRRRVQYAVRPWTAPTVDDPTVILARGDRERVEILMDPLYFDEPPRSLRVIYERVLTTMLALECALGFRDSDRFEQAICLSDVGHEGLPSFTGRYDGDRLLVDPPFVRMLAYEQFRLSIARTWTPWERRERKVLWRGRLNGRPAADGDELLSLARARLCTVARDLGRGDAVDAKLTGVAPAVEERYCEQLRELEPLLGEEIAPERYMESRFLIDIDGWANAWSGLFQKLLTGSTVLKVASQHGFRQWYYDRLEPWVNYVPVRSDLADLDDAVAFVFEHDERAREIGEAGRRLALSLGLEAEIYAMATRL